MMDKARTWAHLNRNAREAVAKIAGVERVAALDVHNMKLEEWGAIERVDWACILANTPVIFDDPYEPTPRPWVCHSGAIYRDAPNVFPKGDETGIRIALMDRDTPYTAPTERDANAKLIVRAVNAFDSLTTALESALGWLNHSDVRYLISNKLGEQAELQRTLGQARAAIALAGKGA